MKKLLQRRRLERLEKRLIAPPRANACEVEVVWRDVVRRKETIRPLSGYRHVIDVGHGIYIRLNYYSYQPNRCEGGVFR